MNDEKVKDIKAIEQIIKKYRKSNQKHVKVVFGTIEKVSLHPTYGVPQMHFDQLNVIAHHLHQMKGHECHNCTHPTGMKCVTHVKKAKSAQRFTRRVLQQRQDWDAWKQA